MGVIATLLPTEAHLLRVRQAVRDRHEIVPCVNWDDVADACEHRPVQLVIADLFSSRTSGSADVRRLKRRFPQITVIAYSAITMSHAHDLFDAGRAGVDALIIADVDDAPRNLLGFIENAEQSGLTSTLRRSLEGVDELVVEAMVLSVSRAHERLSPVGLARLLAVPRRVLAQRLAQAGFPPPQRLLTWGRLIMGARLLEDPKRPADRVAASLSFPSGSAFRNICRRYLHATPGDIRQRGGAAFVTRAMMRQANAHADPAGGRARRPSVAF